MTHSHLLPDEGQVGPYDLLHLLADLLQVLVRQRLLDVKVVEESALRPRAHRDEGLLERPLDGHGHDVRTLHAWRYVCM